MRITVHLALVAGIVASAAAPADAATDPPRLLRFPTLSASAIVFNYAGDLWKVPRDGGEASRLTAGVGSETLPSFSPDGTQIAFTGEYDGNRDVYTIPADGGLPRRLTAHPAEELVRGWTPDGKRVLFASTANSFYHDERQLYTVGADAAIPEKLPVPSAEEAALSPNGRQLAYVPHGQWQEAWKRYRGGQTTPIWIMDLGDSSVRPIPRENSNDHHPIWIGDSVYFLSDRNGPVSLFEFNTKTGTVSEALHSDGFDFKSAAAGPGAIVIEQFGAIKLFDLATRQAHNVEIHVSGDFDELRPRLAKVDAKRIRNFGLSPTGVRAVFEARGEIFTVPTDKGDIRNLTHSPAVADRDPAWSPDGKSIAYFSDESGEYELCIRGQDGLGAVRRIRLGAQPTFYYTPRWSPDGTKLLYSDKQLKLWYVRLDDPKPRLVDSGMFEFFGIAAFDAVWSPDSHYIAYTRQLTSGQAALFAYSLETSTVMQLSDGMSDVRYPAFDADGRYLYFTASTDVALTVQGLDMSSDEHRVTRSVYVAVLRRDQPSPLAPESDEERAPAAAPPAAPGASPAKPPAVQIDRDGISQRILALPIPARNYVSLVAGKAGMLYIAEAPAVITEDMQPDLPQVLYKFDLQKRKTDKFLDEINDFALARDGSKILYRKGEQWTTVAADEAPGGAAGAPLKPGYGPLKLDSWQVLLEPRAAWRQMYHETWRIERDFFYDPNHHGLDLGKAERRYAPYLDGLASRDEFTYLLNEALGELTIGHMFVNGGDRPEPRKASGGLLGADFSVDSGRYRIARIYDGENWNPDLQAPLTQPGIDARPGDYLLAVGGRELSSGDNIYAAFEGTASHQVVIRIGPSPDGKGARDVTVVPIDNEGGLRNRAWIESNRRRVDEATQGRVAYVYVPNTGGGGYTSFNRYFFPQVGREAVIIDERYNEGGQIADYIIDLLRRPLMSKVAGREGRDWVSPSQAIYGPKVMLINEMSGSGGDALPWYFRKANLGVLVGKRTWGGLVGIGGYPELIDGGSVTAPRAAIYGLGGEWEVENRGVPPDVDVERDPAIVRLGKDPQLEKAIEVALKELAAHPLPTYARPAYPNYHRDDGLGKP